MLFDDETKWKQLAKWIIGIIASCILIFLGVRYISDIADAVMWLVDLIRPFLIGVILALILSVPLNFIEKRLLAKHPAPGKERLRRTLAILCCLILVLGIFVGVAILVIPELINAVVIFATTIIDILDQIAALESKADFTGIPYGEYLAQIDIDWVELRNGLESWLSQLGNTIVERAGNVVGNVASSLVDVGIGFVFSIYILANKETLMRQINRLIHAWIPQKAGKWLVHVVSVCGNTFQLFIAGQTTEAVILGTLCTLGMLILQIPYAPMIGALVGVTALIPYVGAFIASLAGALIILTVNPFKAVIFIIFLVILQQVEGNVIYPRVVGAKVNLPAMWVLAAITIGGSLAGPVGMLLGVPSASALYALLKEATEKREKELEEREGEASVA